MPIFVHRQLSSMTAVENWLIRRAESEAQRDVLSFSDRVGNLVAVAMGLVAILYCVAHQTGATGFFTSTFGMWEMALFYGFQLYQVGLSVLKALVGRKNLARVFEVCGAVFGIVALTWFLIVFPFEFAYVADVLPPFLKFLLQWLSNDIARAFMMLGTVASIIAAAYNALLFVFVRKVLAR